MCDLLILRWWQGVPRVVQHRAQKLDRLGVVGALDRHTPKNTPNDVPSTLVTQTPFRRMTDGRKTPPSHDRHDILPANMREQAPNTMQRGAEISATALHAIE